MVAIFLITNASVGEGDRVLVWQFKPNPDVPVFQVYRDGELKVASIRTLHRNKLLRAIQVIQFLPFMSVHFRRLENFTKITTRSRNRIAVS